jgi:protein-tyrosine phosphatase
MVRPWYWPEDGMPQKTKPFTWIIKGKIAASWWPDPSLLEKFKEYGISVIVNCSEFDNRSNLKGDFFYYHFNVPDYGLPSENQIREFISICDAHSNKGEAIVVHCVAGCGRTAQFILAWAASRGFIPKGVDPVTWIRKKRPCSLETKEQEDYARKLAKKFQLNH